MHWEICRGILEAIAIIGVPAFILAALKREYP